MLYDSFQYSFALFVSPSPSRRGSSPSGELSAGQLPTKPSPSQLGPSVKRPVCGDPTRDAAQFWLHFIDQYEAFTDILCAAAKAGCDTHKESEYAQLRRWFVANYYRTAASVRPYLDTEFVQSEALPSIMDYAGQKRCLDALEALFLPPTLREVLKHDTGDLIPRVARISEAIYRCHADWEETQES